LPWVFLNKTFFVAVCFRVRLASEALTAFEVVRIADNISVIAVLVDQTPPERRSKLPEGRERRGHSVERAADEPGLGTLSTAGRIMVTRRPPAGDCPKDISPPWSRATLLATVRPRPEPPVSRLREPSTLKKGRNTSSLNPSGMPGPRSSIRIMISSSQTSRLTSAHWPYLRALSMRLLRQRRIAIGRHM
jgi:hypothetical protein